MKSISNILKSNLLKIFFALIFILLFLAIQYIFCFKIVFVPGDEAWNFQNLYKTFCGLELYKDINIIITPLFFIIGKIVLTILPTTIFSFRIYGLIISLILHILLFIILYKENKSFIKSTLFTALLFNFTYILTLGGANYNVLAFVFVLLGILTFLNHKSSKYYHFMQGFLVFIIFFTKQTFGAFYGLGLLLYEILFSRENYIKNNFQKLITFMLPLLIYISYLYANDSLYAFINYTMLGMNDFKSNFFLETWAALLLLYPVTIFLIKKANKILDKESSTDIIYMATIAGTMILAAFPIFNQYHVMISFVIIALVFFIIIDKVLLSFIIDFNNFKIQIIFSIISIILILVPLLGTISLEPNSLEEPFIIKDSKIYENIVIDEKYYSSTIKLIDYITEKEDEGYDVVIVSYQAVLTNIYLKQFHGDFDLPFRGNLGSDGERKLIEKIDNSDDKTLYLIKNNVDSYAWQESKNVLEHIKTTLDKKEEILDFSVYSK